VIPALAMHFPSIVRRSSYKQYWKLLQHQRESTDEDAMRSERERDSSRTHRRWLDRMESWEPFMDLFAAKQREVIECS